jgi:hypothetical protein
MSLQQAEVEATEVVYDLTGTLLEVCTCGVRCPCWVGEDPDGGECLSVLSYNFTEGTIRGIDVSGRTIANIVHIPGNVLTPGSWRVAPPTATTGTGSRTTDRTAAAWAGPWPIWPGWSVRC